MTNIEEIQSLFGLLYLAGTLKLSHEKTTDLWARDGTSPYFKAVMSEARFRQLLRALRFDDLDTRKERSQNDKLAPIREIVDHMNEKFLSLYSVHENVTIDEMMFSFKGRCSFRQYFPMKHSYGIKTFAFIDSLNYYTSFTEIYTGKQPPGPFFVDNTSKVVVQRIAKSILGTGQNITMDNWFSSIPLIDELQTSHKTTVVATRKKNKKEIPPEFLATKTRPIFSSLIGYSDGKVLSSYVPEKNKCVLVISSMHEECKIDESTGSKQKPEIIMYYN
ncbi:piggyBac transposable element-derived protein 4-like [Athalia rosae]|uniref:piggyBac transposable element-derived protein 4-like n=1 Tax=Athalia rosae TaxID=37344 RepID=UPI002033EA44|nr:piggyBac transposable element-derived protein 4-like [Athalia rosae]